MMITPIDLNCDMGEGMPNDAELMPYISSANIACGYHAGDLETIQRTIDLCMQHNVAIGAHPGFADKANFGRTNQLLNDEDLYDLIINQVMLIHQYCDKVGATIHHVKPHGALYNMAAADPRMAAIIVQAVKDMNPKLILYGLSGSHLISEAKKQGLRVAAEVFADRTYQADGTLTPRSEANALIENETAAVQQVLQMIQQQTVQSISGKTLPIQAATICIHGDGKNAVSFAKNIHQQLTQNKITIAAI
jgi:UPF0271 protein